MPLRWIKRALSGETTTTVATPSPSPVLHSMAPPTDTPAPKHSVAVSIPGEKIAARAYEIWVRSGRRPGQEVQNWLAAEAELKAEMAGGAGEQLPRKSR